MHFNEKGSEQAQIPFKIGFHFLVNTEIDPTAHIYWQAFIQLL